MEQESLGLFWDVLANSYDGVEFKQLKEKLQKRLDNPPTKIFAQCLDREAFTDAQAQQLLFAPRPADMAVYPQLLVGDSTCADDLDVAANKAQAIALTHVYLVHGRVWQRLRPFIEAGGLSQLVQLLSHPQQIFAAQALDLLLYATHPDMYNWNPTLGCDQQAAAAVQSDTCASKHGHVSSSSSSSPSSEAYQNNTLGSNPTAGLHPASGPDGLLWQQLAQLQSGPLLGSLLRLSPDQWPGSGFKALQFLTFYLTWLRRWWCKDGVLQLSASLLSGLSAWQGRAAALPEERQLAAELLADFGRHGPAPSVPGIQAGCAAAAEGNVEASLRVVADRTLVNSRPGSEAERLKSAGNDAFKARDWSTAIQLYSAALDVPVPHEALLDEGPRRATYHANRAAAYLERYKELQASAAAAAAPNTQHDRSPNTHGSTSNSCASWREVGGVLDGLQLDGTSTEAAAHLLQAAVMDCKAALDLVPVHAKAHYRLATALRAQGSLASAQAAAAAAERHASCQADQVAAAHLVAVIARQLSSKQQDVQQLLPKRGLTPGQQTDGPAQQRDGPAKDIAGVHDDHNPAYRVGLGSAGAAIVADHLDRRDSVAAGTPQSSAPTSTQVDAVDALLHQFAAVVKQQSSSSGQQQPASGAVGSRRAVVLLPTSIQEEQQSDQQLLGDQLLLPGHTSSRVKVGGGPAPSRPLIQEL